MTQIYSQPVTFLGDLQGRKSGLGIRRRENADVAARLKLRVTFFCKHSRQNRQLFPTKWNIPRITAAVPCHILLLGHCDCQASIAVLNHPKSERRLIAEYSAMSDVWWIVSKGSQCMEWREPGRDDGSWYGSCIYTQSHTHLTGQQPIYIKYVSADLHSQKMHFLRLF